ncbi:unnamed protein product [Urochloa decumbens]|uniref:C2 NT-type domain-containing protein n=1 Tax=Urochloa decumbens TaxID=240449 RepID=A0ABC8XJK2_9POAL
MFKSRWRGGGGAKAKAVFKLQFHATQVPELGWEAMMVVVTPQDAGRPTARSEPAEVAGGACRWAAPILEATKLPAGKDKIYQFLVYETGSSKAALLGEATVNLAEYADALKPSAVTLPLKGSPGALLHVTIQRVVGGAGGCGDDASSENGDVSPVVSKTPQRRTTLQNQLSRFEDEDVEKARANTDAMSPVQDGLLIRKPPGMRFPSRRNTPMSVDPVSHLHNGSSFDAISVSGSDGSSGRYTPKISASMHSTFLQDSSNTLSPFATNGTLRNPLTSSGDWSGSSAPDASTDGSTSNSGEAGLRGEEDDVEKLRSEIATLTRKLDVSDMELQTLRKQIVKESRRGQDLSKEMSSLREERDALRRECEGLRGAKKTIHDPNGSGKRLSNGEDPWSQIEELKQELSHEKNLNADLRVQLQKMQESNSELLLAVKDLDEMVEQKNRDISILQEGTLEDPQEAEYEHALSNVHNSGHKMAFSETGSEQEKEDELMLDALAKKRDDISASELEKKIVEFVRVMSARKQRLIYRDDVCKIKDDTGDTMFVNEVQPKPTSPGHDYGRSSPIPQHRDLEANVESLDNELQTQVKKFEADIAKIMSAKVEQEQRAIKAEESLRKIRWNNATTAERLQEEFKVLSSQVSSAFSANERHLVQARKEVAELQLQKSQLEELLQKAQGDLGSVQDQHRVKVQQLITLVDFKSKEIDRLLMELKSKSDEFQNQKRCDEAKLNALSEEIDLLNAKIDKLSSERDELFEKNEQKDKELAGISETDVQLQGKTTEITLLNKEIALLKDQVKMHLEELHNLKCLKNEKEETIGKLQIDIGSLKLQCENLKTLLSKKESEKDSLASQVLKLRRSLETREGAKANGVTTDVKDNQHTNHKRVKHNTGSTGSTTLPGTNRQSAEGDCNCNGQDMRNTAEQSSKELASLKERNKAMEEELKELHERYSEISLRFAEVEGERQQLVMTVRSLKNSLR